jgi:E3 Ubiquitin ligase
VHQASISYAFVVFSCGAAGILSGLNIFFRRWREQRLVEDTPAARIRSAPEGYVRLSGRAKSLDGRPQYAPLTGRRCVWWSYRVELRQNGRLPGVSRLLDDCGSSDQAFLLADHSHQCLVDPLGAEVEPSDRKVWYGNSPDDVPVAVMGGMKFRLGRKYRYVEAILSEDAELSILGEFRASTSSITNALEDEAAALLDQWKHDQPALLARFDANHDGRIDAAEWETARAAALTQARHNRLQQAPEQRVRVLAKPDDSRPFLIAAKSAGQLAHTERVRAMTGLAIALLSLLGTCYAIAHVHSDSDSSQIRQNRVDQR